MARHVLVWDVPLRLFHWALAALVVFSYVTGKIGGAWMEWHLKSGYAILTLLVFRIAWGLVGSDTARFTSFMRSPGAALAYLRGRANGRPAFVLGHNPLGGWAIAAMLLVLLAQTVSGLFSDDEISTQGPLAAKVSNAVVSRMSALHSYNEWAIVALVLLHVAALFVYRFVWRVRLVPPMIHGRAEVPDDAIPPPRMGSPLLASMLLAAAAALVYWLVVVYARVPA